jgi:hypothetical protein
VPLAAADSLAKFAHLVQHSVDFRHHVLTINLNRLVLGCPQRHVQHGTILRDVDMFTAEHGIDPLAQTALAGQLQQKPQGLVGDSILE